MSVPSRFDNSNRQLGSLAAPSGAPASDRRSTPRSKAKRNDGADRRRPPAPPLAFEPFGEPVAEPFVAPSVEPIESEQPAVSEPAAAPAAVTEPIVNKPAAAHQAVPAAPQPFVIVPADTENAASAPTENASSSVEAPTPKQSTGRLLSLARQRVSKPRGITQPTTELPTSEFPTHELIAAPPATKPVSPSKPRATTLAPPEPVADAEPPTTKTRTTRAPKLPAVETAEAVVAEPVAPEPAVIEPPAVKQPAIIKLRPAKAATIEPVAVALPVAEPAVEPSASEPSASASVVAAEPKSGAALRSVTELPMRAGSERRRLGELLVTHGRLTEAQLHEALAVQQLGTGVARRRLGQVVVEQGFLTESQLAEALADLLGLEMLNLEKIAIDLEVGRLLSRQVADRNRMVVVDRTDHGLLVAAADPTNIVGLDDVRIYTGASSIKVVVATESQIRRRIAQLWSPNGDGDELATMVEDVALPAGEVEANADLGLDLDHDAEQAPTVRLVNGILADAVRSGASDIHIEPQALSLRIRYRIDGLLRDITQVPRSAAPALISRVKIISGLDIAERRVPQDGRARLLAENVAVDARVSTLPGVHGEKVVIRLMASGETVAPLAKIGLDEQQLEALLAASLAPQGLVLITGPTGSGKTNTLYSVLSQVATPEKNVVTLEDPVEIQLAGITQVQINERAGVTFSKGLRSVLRQDPDVVLVGEVRDAETAELALQASLTGHLVLTTLHTNDAVAALTRLVDMGIEPFLVASSLTMVVAQRLVRKPCPGCAAPYVPSARILALLGLTEADLADATPRRGRGCSDCGNSGYRGRTGIFEVLHVTAAVRSVLLRTPNEAALAAAARSANMLTLRGAGLAKARRGETTFEEVLRVTQVDAAGGRKCTSCDRAVGDDMVVCPWCATTIDQGHCGQCARPLDTGWKICPWCRTPAVTAPTALALTASVSRIPRILLVGSRPALRSFAGSVDGVLEATVVATADAALSAVWEVDYDGVVVDESSSDVNAAELLRLLRTEPHTAAVPLMLLVDEDSKLLPGEAQIAGADEVVAADTDNVALRAQRLTLTARSPYLAS